jgi:hypothetical protein
MSVASGYSRTEVHQSPKVPAWRPRGFWVDVILGNEREQ